jgi:uncharacterized membrane protein
MNKQIVTKLSEIEHRLESHDVEIQELVEAIRELMAPLPENNRRIGFQAPAASGKDNSKALKVHVIRTPKRK